ncbi:MAG: DUF1194 domain-containing protein [Ahrensia sp.]|nr:DUF1194 domain-containing protein [Ahrensia sp.]
MISHMLTAVILACLMSHSARAAQEVDMLLCLAADVSESVTVMEYDLQRKGHAAAIEDAEVVALIESGLHGRIGVAYVEWAKQDQQFLGVDWFVIDGAEAAQEFAERIRRSSSPPWIDAHVRNTSTGEAVQYCLAQFDRAPMRAARRVIDISSDGTSNIGAEITQVRDEAVRRGVVINVLAIVDRIAAAHAFTHTHPEGGLVNYFKSQVAGGVGSFVESAETYLTFGETMKRKFLLELASLE